MRFLGLYKKNLDYRNTMVNNKKHLREIGNIIDPSAALKRIAPGSILPFTAVTAFGPNGC